MSATVDDAALLAAAQAGDAAALGALLAAHQDRVYRFARRMCRDPHDAEDVLQETLLAAARSLGEFRGDAAVSTWLLTIARRACLRLHRRERPAPGAGGDVADDAVVIDAAPSPAEALAGRELDAAVAAAIDALTPPFREVLVLRDVEGAPAADVAAALGLSVAAVKSRLHRARLAMRAHLAPALAAPAPDAACPDVLATLSRHLEDEVDQATCAAMEAHLVGCARCRGACDSLRRTLALCRTSAPGDAVPPPVQARVRQALRALISPEP